MTRDVSQVKMRTGSIKGRRAGAKVLSRRSKGKPVEPEHSSVAGKWHATRVQRAIGFRKKKDFLSLGKDFRFN